MKHLRNFKFMALAMFVAMLSLSFTSCSDDDDDKADLLNDYYIEVTVHDKGTMTSAEAASFARTLSDAFEEASFEGVKESTAKYHFNKLLSALVDNLNEYGYKFSATFKASLKIENGGTVESKIIKFSKEGCTLE